MPYIHRLGAIYLGTWDLWLTSLLEASDARGSTCRGDVQILCLSSRIDTTANSHRSRVATEIYTQQYKYRSFIMRLSIMAGEIS